MSEFSYMCVPRTIPYKYKTITQVFREITTSFPNKEIIINRGIEGNRESLTCRQLQSQATKLAGYLVMKGIKKGDKIALSGPNTLEWVIAELAIIMAGAVVVHTSFSNTDARDVYEIVSIAECKAFLIDPGRKDEYVDMILQLIALVRRQHPSKDGTEEGLDDLPLVLLRKSEHLTSYGDLPGILQLNESDVEFPTLYPEDEIAIFTTSGSTGKPKMIPKTHFHATNNHMIFPGKTYNDRPFGWAAGSPIFTVCQGEPRVFCDSSVATEGHNTMKIWDVIKEEQCTSALLLPYFLLDLVAHENNYKDPFKLDVVITTGQPINNLHTKVAGIFTNTLKFGYGSTETYWNSVLSPIDTAGKIKAGDVGTPLPGVEIKIIDIDGNVLRKGENGELCLRSVCGFEKYYQNTDLTDEVLLPGKWFRSGDIAQINEHDHIIIKGRSKDCISRGTRKILPSSIEEIVITKNGIKNVFVVGVPDKRLYEEICVCYVTDPRYEISPTDIKQFCMEKFVGHDAIDGLGEMPKYFLRFHSLPMLDNGKIDKRQLRTNAIQQLGLTDQMEGELLISNATTER
ncbi:medium-chain acyl-CoA ligase ACSF2, mitochondrial-like [Ostrea edulis]|uniref:medium-chain acyl-CoA ligase ACSF2, mitochondrial-like n=1 Tax=Ostrea edulis TaxID=37623 RepID=UPI0024AF5490|nr:medium-chain acyl-CoA ligase ACSF2, mitochondrial-like [Ostrea edulis]